MAQVADAEPSLLKTLDRYWFGHGSLASLGMFRIMMSGIITTNLILLGSQWGDWFGEHGWVPSYLGMMQFPHRLPTIFGPGVTIPRLDLLGSVTDPRITVPFYIVVVLAGIFTTVGLWTRVASIILALGVVSLHHRNGLILHGGDTVFRICSLYLAVGPFGRSCSIDRLIRVARGIESPEPAVGSLWMQRILSYEVAIIYFTTFWLKYWGSHWQDGTATWYTARLPEFYRFPVPSFMSEPPITILTTYGTLVLEFALGTIVFYRPCRKWVLGLGLMMHGYIEWTMNIPLFAWAMCSMYIVFYDGEEVAAWFRRFGARFADRAITVTVPKKSARADRISAFLTACDPLGLVRVEVGAVDRAVAKDKAGKTVPLVPALLKRNPGLVAFAITGGLRKALAGS